MLSLVLSVALRGDASCSASTNLAVITTVAAVRPQTRETRVAHGRIVRIAIDDTVASVAIGTSTVAGVPVQLSFDDFSDRSVAVLVTPLIPGFVTGETFEGSKIVAIDTKGLTLANGKHIEPDSAGEYPLVNSVATLGVPLSNGACTSDGPYQLRVTSASTS